LEKKYTIVGSSTLSFCNPLIGQDEMGIRFDTEWYSEGHNRQEMEPKWRSLRIFKLFS